MEFDFGGFATKAGLLCSDGVTIQAGAFSHQDKTQVPLLWQHGKNDAINVIGHAVLEDRDGSMYAMARFNNTERGKHMKEAVRHGDVNMMSIYANKIRKRGSDVIHGMIREVSLVIAAANPGAKVDWVQLEHSDGFMEQLEDEAVIYTGIKLEIEHADDDEVDNDETIADVLDTLSDKQKDAVAALLTQALQQEDADDSDDEASEDDLNQDDEDKDGTDTMRHNLFDQDTKPDTKTTELTQAQVDTIFNDMVKCGSLKDAVLQHEGEYGITNIDMLFPEPKDIDGTPEWIKRRTEWVAGVLTGVRRSPFSRIKTVSADITYDTARAKGYIKGSLKKDEFFALTQRTTSPQTVYKRQKFDRDDLLDVTSFDVVAWVKGEMRLMLEEELARAILVGDGRDAMDPDKIKDPRGAQDGVGIRSIAYDDHFYAHQVSVPPGTKGEQLVEAILRSRKHYRGKGTPNFYTTDDILTDMLLTKDLNRRRIYRGLDELSSAARVGTMIPVEVMEGHTNEEDQELLGILTNIGDYNVGADRGGETTFFDDFDIDYNQFKYLYETRVSGALIRYKTAIVFWRAKGGVLVVPVAPVFDDGVVEIPSVAGVNYFVNGTIWDEQHPNYDVGGFVMDTDPVVVVAEPDEGYYFTPGTTDQWVFEA